MSSAMSRPREVIPGEFYFLTRRCTQRQFLLRPGDETNNAFAYCLAEAAERFGITVVLSYAASNHHHTIIFDGDGRYPQFMEHFHKMLARCMNAHWGRWENLWSSQEPCATRLLDRATVIAKLIYVASNPVKDRLVEKATQWPGVNGYRNLLHRQPLKARRPRHFFRAAGVMPEAVTLELTIPPELGPADEVIAEVRAGVEEVERLMRADCARTGARVLGRKTVLEQSWRAMPTSVEPRRRLRPRFAGDRDMRIAALVGYKDFLASYDAARRSWLAGRTVQFPRGTYWLRRFAPIAVTPLAGAPAPT